MIGQRVSATLWRVQCRYREPPQPELVEELNVEGDTLPPLKPPNYIGAEVMLLTYDPSGADLVDVAKMVLRAQDAEDFEIVNSQKLASVVEGLAHVVGYSELGALA